MTHIISAHNIERVVTAVIVANAALLVTGMLVDGHEAALEEMDLAVLWFFAAELSVRLAMARLGFFHGLWNTVDLVVVVVALLPVAGGRWRHRRAQVGQVGAHRASSAACGPSTAGPAGAGMAVIGFFATGSYHAAVAEGGLTSLKTDIEVLDDAIELIEADDGWYQGGSCKDAAGHHLFPCTQFATRWGWADAEGLHAGQPVTFCLEGAIRMAAGWPPFWTWGTSVVQARQQAAHAAELNQQAGRLESLAYRLALQDMTGIPSTWGGLHDFNDDEHTTREEAVLVLKHARAHLVENENGGIDRHERHKDDARRPATRRSRLES